MENKADLYGLASLFALSLFLDGKTLALWFSEAYSTERFMMFT